MKKEFNHIVLELAHKNNIEMDDKVIYEKDLSCDMVEKIIRVLSECRMPVVLEGSTDYWIDDEGFEDDPYVD